ncbi:hypothetical protein M3O96_20760 [Aquiflexum sp. TKW24L]|uniref:hypothetical protein n=1 Tax=Aquiflexum sp. TKW24L TaxID=2942212 RepID=UPI0020BD81E4|nr:hypothetical protein [Aquiflexum sp. TKW24L]MCL6261544.1 hypothetical protein [Aquiflexum sp. TKW24L]
MKTTTLILIPMLFLSILGFAQEADSVKKGTVNTTNFTLFNTNVIVYKNADGTKTWEFISKDNDEYQEYHSKNNKSSNGLTLDIGINTWIGDDAAPAVKPWGSWNPAINYHYTYKPSKNFNLKSTIGVSWYNFKFEDRNLQALRGEEGLVFVEHPSGAGTKSKISASYANLTLVPTVQTTNGNFSFGVGPYAGYRLGGKGKVVYRDPQGNKAKEFQMGNMFAADFRYGLRAEICVADVKLYVNYDFNETFQENKGPKLNALSFGFIL